MRRVLSLAALATVLSLGMTPLHACAEDRYRLTLAPGVDSLLAVEKPARGDSANLWSRADLQSLAARWRDRLLVQGRIGATLRLTLEPGAPGDSVDVARLALVESPASRARLAPVVRGGEDLVPDGAGLFLRASGGAADPRSIQNGLAALRAEAQARGRYGAEAELDSVVAVDSATVRAYVSLDPGPPVAIDSLDLGSSTMRPSVVGSISGLTKGRVLTPEVLDDARTRLEASELFASVGAIEVAPGVDPGHARVAVPLVENRLSRFEGALGIQNQGGVTGLFDLALGNIGGSGRAAGAHWAGYGEGRSEYAAHYREPSLFGTGLDGALALEAQVADSLYTQTKWSLELSGRPFRNARAGGAIRRSGSAYTGAGRGTSATWSLEGNVAWRALLPIENPMHGMALSITGEAGRRMESYPGYPRATRGLLRGSVAWEAARATGAHQALYAAARAEEVRLGGEAIPAEELRFLGGAEGLRGHRDREFAGDRILAMTLEHRWITGPRGGRVFLFVDGALHELRAPLEAGSARGLPNGTGSLARTELSDGWDFGYGAGLRSPIRAGTVGLELGLSPGEPLRESKLHLRYSTDW
jgi:outer membrane protein assembly factor BamA